MFTYTFNSSCMHTMYVLNVSICVKELIWSFPLFIPCYYMIQVMKCNNLQKVIKSKL